MKKKYFLNANIIDPHNSIEEVGGLIVNEEGKLMGLPLNPEATLLWKMTFDNDNYVTGRKDFVVGPAIYIKKHALKDWA